jgi:hypothetical protein
MEGKRTTAKNHYMIEDKDFQLMKKYIHDIRNLKTFNGEILRNINNLPYEHRMEILITFNEMTRHYLSLLEDE